MPPLPLSPLATLLRALTRAQLVHAGALARTYLGTPYNLQEARTLYELAHGAATPGDLSRRLGFDPAYVTRILHRLFRDGLIRRRRDATDARSRKLALTAKGRAAYRLLDRKAQRHAEDQLRPVAPIEREALGQALRRTLRALDPQALPARPQVRPARPGELGWVFQRQVELYATEYDYGPVFERYVCQGLAPFLDAYDPHLDHLWIGKTHGLPAGAIAIQHDPKRRGWAKLRWYFVEGAARGHGLGTLLLETAIQFARDARYQGIYLWTMSDLAAARQRYQRAGFLLVHQDAKGAPWKPSEHEQRWELPLR